MLTPRLRFPIAILLVLAGCRDAAAPLGERNAAGPRFSTTASTAPHILQQSPTAPRLEAYRVSVWAKRGTQASLIVNYRPAPGQSQGDPFLRFRIPPNGLVAGAGGVPLNRGDSVLITATIDSVSFLVDFQPSGVLFSKSSPAQVAVWYQDANLDLNGDGVVDAADAALLQQLGIWSTSTTDDWQPLSSKNDRTQQYVISDVYHFSGYAVAF